MEVHKVGHVDDPLAKPVRIVHISDTHMHHNDFLSMIPAGDILVHSGDFCAFKKLNLFKYDNINSVLREIDSFFEKVPFKHSIFVAGNHDGSLTTQTPDFIQTRLANVHYLHDSGITVEGIHFYGAPWTTKRTKSFAQGFSKNRHNLVKYWDRIPQNTDIVVTHMPPLAIMDEAKRRFAFLSDMKDLLLKTVDTCSVCGGVHYGVEHWGCPHLQEAMLERVRPTLHLFGHVHESAGIRLIDGVTFSNAAMKFSSRPNVFDYYVNPTEAAS